MAHQTAIIIRPSIVVTERVIAKVKYTDMNFIDIDIYTRRSRDCRVETHLKNHRMR